MSNYFLYYVINSDNQLLISLYHQDISAKIAFRLLSKGRDKPNYTTGELPQDVDKVNSAIIRELTKIQTSLAETIKDKSITEVIYTGDVNLGFAGNTIFPSSLFDSSIHQLFKNHSLFAKAKVYLYLETHNTEIAQSAAKLHLLSYSKEHDKKYPNTPVVIRLKSSKTPFYTSPQDLSTVIQPHADQNRNTTSERPATRLSNESHSPSKRRLSTYNFFQENPSKIIKYVDDSQKDAELRFNSNNNKKTQGFDSITCENNSKNI